MQNFYATFRNSGILEDRVMQFSRLFHHVKTTYICAYQMVFSYFRNYRGSSVFQLFFSESTFHSEKLLYVNSSDILNFMVNLNFSMIAIP